MTGSGAVGGEVVTIAFRLRSKLHSASPPTMNPSTTCHHCLSAAEQAPLEGAGTKGCSTDGSPLPFGCGASSTTASSRSSVHIWSHHCLSAAEQAPRRKAHHSAQVHAVSPLPFGCGASSTPEWSQRENPVVLSPLPFGCGASSTADAPELAHHQRGVTIAFRLRSKLHPVTCRLRRLSSWRSPLPFGCGASSTAPASGSDKHPT